MKLFNLKKTSGFTLVEIMVALALGLVITIGVTSIVIISNRNSSVTDTYSEAQESGRYAMSFLQKAIINTGYDPTELNFQSFANECTDYDSPSNCSLESASGTGDRLAISRYIDGNDNDVSCSNSDLGYFTTDADGNDVGSGATVTDVFWVEENSGVTSLYCQTYFKADNSTSAKSPLVTGIEALHLLYGVSLCSTNSGDRNVTVYLSADEVENPPAAITNQLCTDGTNQQVSWWRVFSVKIGILARGAEESMGQDFNQTYVILDSEPYRFTGANTDQYPRQLFTTTATRSNY